MISVFASSRIFVVDINPIKSLPNKYKSLSIETSQQASKV